MNLVRKLTAGMEPTFWAFTALSPVLMVGEVLMETTIPRVMAGIVDVGIASKDTDFVVRHGLLMVLMAAFSLCCGAGCGRFSSVAAFGFSRNVRRMLFRRVQGFSFSNMDKFGTGSLITRLTTDVTNVQNLYQNLIRSVVRAPLMLILGTVMAAFINARLACIFLVSIPMLAVVLIAIASAAYPRFQKMFEVYDALNRTVQENLIAIRVVKSFVRGEFEAEKFSAVAEDLRGAQVRAEKIVILNMPVMQVVMYACIVCVLWFGGNMILAGSMTVGALISFLTYISQILMSLMMLSMMFVQFILCRASVARILEVLDEMPAITSPGTPGVPPEKDESCFSVVRDGSIDFTGVSFSYTGALSNCVLTDVDVHIPSGATVGILGGTGAAKSTLVQLIPRLYDVTAGMVQVGGIDVRKYDLASLRRAVGVVLQKNVLFSGTIADNLRWGNAGATDEELIAACTAADAHGFVSALPAGYATELGQGGVNLSGGQKQRLCIARALLKKPKILILDDSMSAVDTATDRRIRAALRTSLPGTTKLIIAQRIVSVQDADTIIVLDDGRISGIGTHQTLLAENKIYREVYESQMNDQSSTSVRNSGLREIG